MPANIKLLRAAGAAGAVLALSSCTALGIGEVDDPALNSCPDTSIAADVLWDASGSSASKVIYAERLDVIRDVARRTALCDGRLRVTVFSSSSGATSTIYDGDLHLEGTTDQAKLRKVDELVQKSTAEIEANYAAAVEAQPTNGSDITSILRLAGEYAAQFPDSQLDLYVLSDGFNNIGVNLEAPMSAQAAIDLASTATTPELSGAWVTFAGLGRVDGNTSSSQAETLIAFYTALCTNTQASTCTVVTDYIAKW